MQRNQWDDLDELFSKCDAYLKSWSTDAVEYGQTPHLITLLEEFEQQLNRLKVALAGTEFPKSTVTELGKKLSDLNNVIAAYKLIPSESACDPAQLAGDFDRLKRFVQTRTGGGDHA